MDAISSHLLPKLPNYQKSFTCFHMPKTMSSSIHTPNSLHDSSVRIDISSTDNAISRSESNTLLIFNALDEFINKFIDPPRRPSVNPRHVLSGNFAPVDELSPTECEILEGFLPPCLDGVYVRNGPNPQFFPQGPHHLFDGDGMLHSIKISQGKATFCSRYVKTYRYMLEHEMGSSIIHHVFSSFNGLVACLARGVVSAARMLSGQFTHVNGLGVASTSLAFFGGNLYALDESDLPYAIRMAQDGDIFTLGRCDFNGKLVTNMTAHPKADQDSGETFAFRYSFMRPYLSFFRFDNDGIKQPDVPIFSMASPSFVHDFAITKNYAIFPQIQLEVRPLNMVFGSGSPLRVDQSRNPRIGVIPRYAKDETEIKWFKVPGLNILHAINAWEENSGDTIVMVAPNILTLEHFIERMDLFHSLIEKVKIDLKTGTVSRHPLSTRNLEFGVINPTYLGMKNRYVYASVGDPMPKVSGVVKLDVSLSGQDSHDCVVASRFYESGCYGGEPFFVAKEQNNPNLDEDDGYLVSYVHNENTKESTFLVMDAKSATLEIIAAVNLPQRVPYGFHGLFVREDNLKNL